MRNHTKTFHIRFTEKEYERLCKYAAKTGLPKTTYIRHMINGCCPKEKPPAEFWRILREIHTLGNNLNQLTRLAHQFGSFHAANLDEMSTRHNELSLAIIQRMYEPEGFVPATLKRGQLLALDEQRETARNI